MLKSTGKRKKVKARKPKEDILDSDDDMESKPRKSPKKGKDSKTSNAKEDDSKKLMEAIVAKKEKRHREGNNFLSNLMSKYVNEGEMYDDPFTDDDFPTAKKINPGGGAKKKKKNK